MEKIKIIQIAYIGERYAPLYLDNKGRVWRYDLGSTTEKPEWKQVDLPDEPNQPQS